jgi:hypothetical protein
MAIGSFIGQAAGDLFGKGRPLFSAGAQLAGAGWDAYQANRSANRAQGAYEQGMAQDSAAYGQAMDMAHMGNQWQMGQHQQQLAQANAQTGERVAMRNRLLDQTSHLGAAMRQAYDHLGMPYRPGQDEIQQDYQNIRGNHFDSLNRLVDNATSRTQAGSVARGMDSSTQHRDQQADWVRQFTPQYREADQAAFDHAVNRAGSQQNLFQQGRNNFLGEMENVMGAQFGREAQLYNNQWTPYIQAPNLNTTDFFRTNPNTGRLGEMADSRNTALADNWNRLGEAATGMGTAAFDWWKKRSNPGADTV